MINAGGMFAREIGALAGVNVPIIPMAHEYLVLRAVGPADRHADDARSVAARLLPARVGRSDHGRLRAQLRPLVARRDPGGLQRQAARGGLAAVRGADGERDRARPDARGDGSREADQRARGLHARRGVHPRPVGRARLLGRRRLLRPRPCGRRAGWGSSWRNGSSRARRRSTSGTWTRVASAPPTGRASTRSPVRPRSTRPTTTSSIPATSARPAGRCASRRPTSGSSSSAPRSARSRAGSARTGSSRTPSTVTSRCGRAAGPASSGRRPSASSIAPAARRWRSSTSRRSRRSTSSGPGAAAFLESMCANRVAREVGAVTYTQMLNARGGIECDFTVTRLAEDRFRIVTGTAFGQHDLAWIRQHAPRATARCTSPT